MISVTLESISKERDAEFRAWTAKGPFNTLLEILEAQENQHWCDAFNQALKADESNMKLDAANASLGKYQRYHALIEILKELRDRAPEKHFYTSKVTSHAH